MSTKFDGAWFHWCHVYTLCYRSKFASVMADLRRLADDELYLQFPVDVRCVRSSGSCMPMLSPHADSDSIYFNILAWRYISSFLRRRTGTFDSTLRTFSMKSDQCRICCFYYQRDRHSDSYGPVSVCVCSSVTSLHSIKTSGHIELFLAWWLLSTYATLCVLVHIVVWPTMSCFADWSKCRHVTLVIEWSTRHGRPCVIITINGHVTVYNYSDTRSRDVH